MRCKRDKRIAPVERAIEAGEALHATLQSFGGIVFHEQLCRLGAVALQRSQIAAHHERRTRIIGSLAAKQRDQHAQLNLCARLRREAALGELAATGFRCEKRAIRRKRRAHIACIGSIEFVGQNR